MDGVVKTGRDDVDMVVVGWIRCWRQWVLDYLVGEKGSGFVPPKQATRKLLRVL